jgi:hypothetical protein
MGLIRNKWIELNNHGERRSRSMLGVKKKEYTAEVETKIEVYVNQE